jgi:TonB family protein
MTRCFLVSVLGLALAAHTGWASAAGSGLLAAHMPQLLTLEQQKRLEVGGYAEAVRARIVQDQRYPREALNNAWEGTTEVVLVIGPDGLVQSARVEASSGHVVLDAEAVTKARAATDLPMPPRFLRGRAFRVAIPIVFRLER